MNLLIEATRSDSRRIERVLVIRGPNNEDALILLKAIELGQNLVNGGARRRVLLAKATRCGQKGIDFINKDDAGFVFPCLLEQLSHTLGTHTDKHLIKT